MGPRPCPIRTSRRVRPVVALALHDTAAPDDDFRSALLLVEHHADDERPLVTKAQTMALRAIGTKRLDVRPDVIDLAERLANDAAPTRRRIGKPILKAFT